MKREQIENLFRSLAQSQGFYGRLLRDIYSLSPEIQDKVWKDLEDMNFADDIDVILFVEG